MGKRRGIAAVSLQQFFFCAVFPEVEVIVEGQEGFSSGQGVHGVGAPFVLWMTLMGGGEKLSGHGDAEGRGCIELYSITKPE